MRTVETLLRAIVIGAALAAAPALAFDGSKTDAKAPPPLTPMQAFRSGAHWLKAGETAKAVHSLEYAAEKGHAIAQWKLGRMYAEGEGVTQNDLKAFEYFRHIADEHADDNPDTRQARFVANAFVALGQYYLDGIPNTKIKRDPERAHEMFAYAASYFRDPDAQYYLARLYLDGVGAPHDPRTAARWFGLSAQKGIVPGAGHAGRHAVHRRPRATPGRARPDVADARQGCRQRCRPRLDQPALRQRLPTSDPGRARAGAGLSAAMAGDAAGIGCQLAA